MNMVGVEILRIFGILLGILATTYIGITAFLFMFQSNFVFFPSRVLTVTPDLIGLVFESVEFTTSDGTKLSGWFIPVEKNSDVILFCHGNAGNISHRLESIRIFHKLGYSIFIFDYRGYGRSAGSPSEKGTYLDVEAAWNYLVNDRKVQSEKIIVFGRSLGGAIAAWLAQNHQPRALIVESTFTSIKDIGAELYPILPIKLLVRMDYNTMKYLQQVACPVLIIHSPDDEIVPFNHGRQLFTCAKKPKTFLVISGSHNEGFLSAGEHYVNGLRDFLTK